MDPNKQLWEQVCSRLQHGDLVTAVDLLESLSGGLVAKDAKPPFPGVSFTGVNQLRRMLLVVRNTLKSKS